ncbi:ABC transporter permease [Georgenia thermotolerans]|uniref:FtsX-like permease family protein n=1 Tax=Georgenia thermotolerans TaxID=527326 RepID=A0A7J5UUX9_9MICO|nr:ABC transporter permease [Georgenia thermotolerans]KAE8766077.1 FtsX-like permease family protein [Georgenia thermotolerans]
MWHLTLAHVRAHRSRFALTLLAVVLGVTFVAGSLVLTDTSQRLFEDQFRTATAGVDLTVRDAAAFDSAMGVEVERDPLPATLLDDVRAVPGVADAAASAAGQGLLKVDGEALVPAGASLLASWSPAPYGAFEIRTGHAPTADGEVVLDVATARTYGLAVGDRVTVQADTTETLTVVGLAGFGAEDGLANTTMALVALPTAQRLLDLGDQVTQVQAVAADGVAPADLQAAVAAELGSDYDVATAQDTLAAGAAAARSRLAMIRVMLLSMAGAALLVGGFLIANTFAIVIAQRARELALLRAAGATARQLRRSVLGEAAVIGLAGSALGTALGVAAAYGLRGMAGAFGVALPDGGLVVAPRTVLVSVAIGVVVTVLGALGPARKAAKVAPIEAMRESAAVPARRGRVVTGVVAATVAVAAVGSALAGAPVAVVAAGAVAALVALTLLGPVLAPGLARVVGRPLDAAGLTGRLARESAARAPRRTAATTTALAIGLTLITFMTVVGASVKASLAGTYEEVVRADLVIESARAEMLGGLSHEIHHAVEEVLGVAVVSRMRYGHWKDAGATSALTAVDPATLGKVADVDMVAGSLADLAAGGIVLAEGQAAARGLGVGDALTMTFARTGDQQLPVVGIIDDGDAQALATGFLIAMDTYAQHFTEDVDASLLVGFADGADAQATKAAVTAALEAYPTAAVRDLAEAVAARASAVDQILGMVTVLLLLAVAIALLGITNTLALSIVERTREIGLLRAIGTTRRQVRWMVRWEAVLVAALAVVIGVGLGAGLGAATVRALSGADPVPVAWPLDRLLLVVALTAVGGLVAGLLPARRAARLDVLQAVAAQ